MLMLLLRYSEPLTVIALLLIVLVEFSVLMYKSGGWLW